jgi:DNA-binding NarL/FixJ family response regulator
MHCVPLRVLIVDDQASFRRAAHALLELRGYAVVGEARCAESALEAVERARPDAVLLDVRLHRENGFDVARALTRARPALAVLLVSADDYRDCEDLMEYSGARGFVMKSELAAIDLARFWPDPAPH